MYQIKTEPFGDFTKVIIQNSQTGNGFEIVPEFGANVLQVYFNNVPVLDGYTSPAQLIASKGSKNVLLFPFANRLKSGKYSWKGKVYTFPINNEATGNAIHGIGRKKPFHLVKTDFDENKSAIVCRYDYAGDNPAYPFPFTFDVNFAMHEPGEFAAQLSITNNHSDYIPVGIGWHPYFKIAETTDELQLKMPKTEQVLIDKFMIPTGQKRLYTVFENWRLINAVELDTCFKIHKSHQAHLGLISPIGKLNYWQESDTDNFNFIQIYTPADRASLAIEPMTCNIDAFNNKEGLTELAPNATLSSKFGFNFIKNLNA